ncbi:heterokaryon incompatibility protein-domain-containing protein [Hypoxylon sp. NC1633]|nr:heterokaryon incompatibility protein-domain-containing protein [Hypoxylon sp. NC1633]
MDGTTTSPSIYRPLDRGRQEIRLIYLDRFSSDDDTITCWMTTASLETSPLYVALSYVWGDQPKDVEISVNDTILVITRSLARALKHLRRSELFRRAGHLPLWADAICIDQTNLAERGHQVNLMGSVFSGARFVLSWLGEPGVMSQYNISFDIVRKIIAYVERRGTAADGTATVLTQEDMDWMAQHPRYPDLRSNLSYSRYWTRTWIVQEMVLASHAERHLFYYGDDHVTYRQLELYDRFLKQIRITWLPESLNSWGSFSCENVTAFPLIQAMKDSTHHADKASDIVYSISQCCTSTDPRDAIYGLLGILPINMEPDYNKPVAEVYRGWFTGCLALDDYTSLLSLAGIGYDSFMSDGLSSWVPDLRRDLYKDSIIVTRTCVPMWLDAVSPVRQPTVESVNILNIRGVRLATLGAVSYARPERGEHESAALQRLEMRRWFWWLCVDRLVASGGKRYRYKDLLPIQATLAVLYEGQTILEEPADLFPLKPSYRIVQRFRDFLAWGCESDADRQAAADKLGLSNSDNLFRTLDCNFFCADEEATNPLSSTTDILQVPAVNEEAPFSWLDRKIASYQTNAFFLAVNGDLGIGPPRTAPGDVVCFLDRTSSSVVLRQLDDSTWAYVGTCYVLGLKEDETVKKLKSMDGDLFIEEFNLR